MSYEPKDNSGSVFVNNRKEKETHPDRTGSARIDGVDYYVSGWVKKDKNGNPWLSLSFKRKDENQLAGLRDDLNARQNRASAPPIDDDIPFAPEWR